MRHLRKKKIRGNKFRSTSFFKEFYYTSKKIYKHLLQLVITFLKALKS